MAKQLTQLQPSGQAMIYNFLLNEILASQLEGSYEFWIVAPWVTNFRLEKPYYVSFQEIVETKQEALHLFDILHQIAANGGKVYITVGSDKKNYPSLRELSNKSDSIQIKVLPKLHAKVYVGRYGAIEGSLNLTDGGINQNFELFTYKYDERSIAELRKTCTQYFEQGLQLP